jgi:hypothetical protein
MLKVLYMNFIAMSYVEERHYDILNGWAVERKAKFPAPNELPKTGCVVCNLKSEPLCAGFLFLTGTPNAVMANLMSDSKIDKVERSRALDYLIISIQWAARDLGVQYLMCSSNIDVVKDRFQKLGFEKGDENVTIYRRDLCQPGD